MTEVAAAFPSTMGNRVVRMLQACGANLTIILWIWDWLSERSAETWTDGRPVGTMSVDCGVPQGSPIASYSEPMHALPTMVVAFFGEYALLQPPCVSKGLDCISFMGLLEPENRMCLPVYLAS